MKSVLRIVAIALAVGVAAFIVPGITVTGDTWQYQALTLLAVAVVIALVNMLVRPIVHVLTGCLIVLTFGLFLFVVNAAMLLLTSWVCGQIGVGFNVNGWWAALLGSIIISVVSGMINGVTGASTSDTAPLHRP